MSSIGGISKYAANCRRIYSRCISSRSGISSYSLPSPPIIKNIVEDKKQINGGNKFLVPHISSYVNHIRSDYNKLGGLEGVILDFSGTVVDNYVIAPALAFVQVFEKWKLNVTMNEARLPMGIRKDLHIKEMLKTPNITEQFKNVYKRLPTDEDAKLMYNDFIPIQLKVLEKHSDLIPGTQDVITHLQWDLGLAIGITTGFQRIYADLLDKAAQKQGVYFDAIVAGDDVKSPRPSPHMLFKTMERLNLHNVAKILKVDDTVSGIQEGLNSRTWTCGVFATSNYMNINNLKDIPTMSKLEWHKRLYASRIKLIQSGAHYVVPDITWLPKVIQHINHRRTQPNLEINPL